ncbi:MAG: B12-binding domain-containing radical SAM protein, partial [Armatimonadetes bacterium]|nr:B12-binding domain-containing radical SAM protein [Anaerolineae bacterium]
DKTHLLQKYGIEAGMFIMLGYEREGIRELEETVEHLKRSNPDIFLTTVAYPIKGTPYYAEVESRVLAERDWQARSDRDLTVAGRFSARFYAYATRWMVSEVALHRAATHGGVSLRRRVKLWANAKIGRIGMALTHGEREKRGTLVVQPSQATS